MVLDLQVISKVFAIFSVFAININKNKEMKIIKAKRSKAFEKSVRKSRINLGSLDDRIYHPRK